MADQFTGKLVGVMCFILFFYAEVNAQSGDSLKAAFTFTPSKICDSATVRFTDQSSPKDSIISWLWNFGDPKSGINNYSLVGNPSHKYDHAGTYIIILAVADVMGNVSTAEDSVTIGVRPQAEIGLASPTCVSRSIQFLDSSVSSSPIISWKWFFGVPGNPNNTSFIQNPSHTYDQSGVYTVHLIITDSAACIDTGQRTITIHDNPIVNLTLSNNSICPQAGDTIHIQASPLGGVLSGVGIANDMIAGSSLTPNTIDTISYFFIDSFQCYGSDTEYLRVNKLPVLTVSADTLTCEGDTIRLHAFGGVTYVWNGDNNIINSDGANPLVFPDSTVRYVVNAADANSCTAKDSVLVTVYRKTDVKISADTAICKGASVRLHASGAFSYDWQPKTLLDSSNISSPLAFPLSTTLFILTANKGTHCQVNDSTTIFVHQKPNLTVSNDTSLCAGDTVTLSVSGAVFYQWSPAAFLINSQSSHPLAFPDSSTTFFVTGLDSIGCSNIDSVHVKIIYGPKADAGNDASVCFGDTVQLHGTGGKYFLWQPSNEVSNDTSANPLAFPKTTTDFILTVSNGACPGS